jgi:hypothetical protein
VRCVRCGNENAATNRFCAMCGASLVAAAPAGGPIAPAEVRPAPLAPAETKPDVRSADVKPSEVKPAEVKRAEARRAEVRPSAGPVVTGPSILGLSNPGPAVDRVVDRQADPDPLRPSSNLDYLLEDEEESTGGWGKLILIVAALALAAGFGFLYWRQGGFAWLNDSNSKPAAAQQAANAGPDSAGVARPESSAPAATPAPVAAQPVVPSPTASTPTAPPPSQTQSAQPQSTQSQSTQSQSNQSQSTQPQSTQSQLNDPNLPVDAGAPAASSDADATAPPAQPAPAPKPSARRAAAPKPSPAKRQPPAQPIDPVVNAERYIYGRGESQDCDRGLRMLKPAADQSNTRAMISMGALYSTGTCTPRDLPTAYRWFALALHKEPDNQALQEDLQKLWSQMTPPERQLAIKLSQ